MNDRGHSTRLSLAILATAVSVAFLVAGCAEIGFPAVHDMPAPRADTTMTPDQVKQATDDLVSERDRLNTGSLPSAQAAAPSNAPPAKKRALPQKNLPQKHLPQRKMRRRRLRQTPRLRLVPTPSRDKSVVKRHTDVPVHRWKNFIASGGCRRTCSRR